MALPSASRIVPRHQRYAAAGNRMQYGDFNASSGSADFELMTALPVVRNKIRALARNSGTMKRYLSLLKSNVVGENGFNLQVRVRKQDGKPDKTLNSRVENAWAEFCMAPTVDGEMDIIEFEKQMVTSWARDGEYIIELVNDPEAIDGFLLNPIEGDILDETLNNTHPSTGNRIKMGVEISNRGRPVAYHFLQDHPGDTAWEMRPVNKRHRRVSARKVIHVFERLRAGQTRGEPQPSSLVGTTKMLDGYREAEITGRRVKSSAMGLIIDKDDSTPAGTGLDGMADRVSENEDGEEQFEMDMEPGTFKSLPRGKDFKQFDPGGSVSDFAEFDGQIKTDASMGVSISPVSLGYETRKLSYSTHRGVIAEDRETYRDLQSFFIRMAMNKIFAYWLSMHLAYNVATTIPPSRKLGILAMSKFTGRSWMQIDPTKDTKAENDQLAARTTSLTRICADRGISRDDLLDEIEDDEQALKDRGLTQDFGGGNNSQTTSSGGKDDEDDEDDDT